MKFKMSTLLTAPAVVLMLSSLGTGVVNAKQKTPSRTNQVSRQVLKQTARKVGGYGSHTTGGEKAASHPVNVYSLSQLHSTLKRTHGQPAVVILHGHLDGNYDEKTGKTLTAKDYANGTGYSLNKYLKAYSPKTYGRKEPAGKLENARKTAQKRQEHQVTVNVPSNVTLYGAPGNRIQNVNFKLSGRNDILRNLNLQAPVDDFPGWDPKDGQSGNWNSQYDAISVRGARKVWLDGVHVSDGKVKDKLPSAKTFNRQYQQHDGEIDITNAADQLTVTNSKLEDHDKAMLIGNANNKRSDAGKLHVTLNHDTFENVAQRAPRVRYGHVQIKNSTFKTNDRAPYRFQYVWLQGRHANLTAKNDHVWDTKQPVVKSTRQPAKSNVKLAKKAFVSSGTDLRDADSQTQAQDVTVNGQKYNLSIHGNVKLSPYAGKHANRKPASKKAKRAKKARHLNYKKQQRKIAHRLRLEHHDIDSAFRYRSGKHANAKKYRKAVKRLQKEAPNDVDTILAAPSASQAFNEVAY